MEKINDPSSLLVNNFHKLGLEIQQAKYTLGTEKLDTIRKIVLKDGFDKNQDRLIIPFGGPGSITIYWSVHGIRTMAGDILYNEYNPDGLIERFKKTYQGQLASYDLTLWDATNLPIENNSEKFALVNPPYGIECEIDNPLSLLKKNTQEISRILKINGIAYYIFPKTWETIFMDTMHLSNEKTIIPGISNSNSANPLCLIKVKT